MRPFRASSSSQQKQRQQDVPVAGSDQMQELLDLAERAAASDAKVLITGESGAGKDVIARYIHAHSPRTAAEYVAVNCAGVTETLLESELFGHVRGSFTGAYRDKIGKLQLAHQGTLFLDEVGEMSLRMQALLLRFLENGEIQSVGADTPRTAADVRVLAATNKNLGELVRAGQFREDLLFRLRVIHLHVPPLRERPGDIRPLVDRFLERLGRPIRLTDAAWRALERYRWPGNVRELQNVVEQLAWLSPDGLEIDVDQLPGLIVKSGPAMLPGRERRRQIADELFQALVGGGYSFWEHIHPLFLQRDITRHDVRELVRRGLSTTRGNYRALLQLFGIPAEDYKRFMNFLAAHGCRADFREFRNASGGDHSHAARPARSLLAPLSAPGGEPDKRDGPRHKAAS